MPAIKNAQAKFQRALEELRQPDVPLTSASVYSLSDLDGDNRIAFQDVWDELPVERRRGLINLLVETAEMNFELDFSVIIFPALDDPDFEVRLSAIDGILEDSPRCVIERLMQIAEEDPYTDVRAAAVESLGQFVLQGELGKLPEPLNTRLQELVLALYRDPQEDLDVRRRALEAIGNCSRDGVLALIRQAYNADELMMRVSAVFAMGRTCDDVWQPQIMEELSSDHPEMRYEAARAAGELELRPALPRLAELAYDDDRQIQEMSIWSLGEIGGKVATKVLNDLAKVAENSNDEALAEAVAEAQANASLSGDVLPLFDFPEYDDEAAEDDVDLLLDDDEIDDLYDLEDIEGDDDL